MLDALTHEDPSVLHPRHATLSSCSGRKRLPVVEQDNRGFFTFVHAVAPTVSIQLGHTKPKGSYPELQILNTRDPALGTIGLSGLVRPLARLQGVINRSQQQGRRTAWERQRRHVPHLVTVSRVSNC